MDVALPKTSRNGASDVPWLKRIDLATGTTERLELDAAREQLLERRKRKPNPLGLPQPKGNVRLQATAEGWRATPGLFADASRQRLPWDTTIEAEQVLKHGMTLDAGDCGYVFLEYPESREPSLEQAALTSDEAAGRWATWLEQQGDPYAAPLRAMLAGETFGGRQRWWLEGIDRGVSSVGARFEMRGGFLRNATLVGGSLPLDLHLFHLLSLRVAQGLEELTVDFSGYVVASFWLPFAKSAFWTTAKWPPTLRRIKLSTARVVAGELRQCAEILSGVLPGIVVEA